MPLFARQDPSAAPEPYVVPPSQQFDGNDGSWSTFKVSIGSPGQDFRMLASTKSGQTFVVVPEGCLEGVDPPDCPALRGADVFNSAQSPGFLSNSSSTWSTIGQFDVDLDQRLNYSARAMFGYDKVTLGPAAASSSLSLDEQVVAGVADLAYYLGHIPLGVPDSSFSSLSSSIDAFIYQLRNKTVIPSLSFAYTAGAKYRLKSVFAQLILGGYDSTRFKPNDNDFFTFSTDPSRLLTVGVESITATNTLKGTYSLSSGTHFSLIDSTIPHLWLPRDICDAFETAFGLTFDPLTDLYLINSTMRDQLKARNPSITLKLVDSLENTSVDYTNIVLPYSAFDLQVSYPYYSNPTNYFPIRRAANDTQYTLGRTLLQEAYLIVDYERANFTVSQAVFPDPLPAAQVVTIHPPGSTPSESSGSGLSTGAIAGIVIGAVLLLLLAVIGFFLWRHRVSKQKYELANTQILESPSTAQGFASPHKADHPPELGGTPLTELAGRLDVAPPKPQFYEMDADSVPSRNISQAGSHAPSEDGRHAGVSPLTGQFR